MSVRRLESSFAALSLHWSGISVMASQNTGKSIVRSENTKNIQTLAFDTCSFVINQSQSYENIYMEVFYV